MLNYIGSSILSTVGNITTAVKIPVLFNDDHNIFTNVVIDEYDSEYENNKGHNKFKLTGDLNFTNLDLNLIASHFKLTTYPNCTFKSNLRADGPNYSGPLHRGCLLYTSPSPRD